uniref:AP-5 complex subunit sigma-1 n=1 Tax=Anas platyrhynchos TaxID=8839 RepID=A0A8B9ZI16_ANAPL
MGIEHLSRQPIATRGDGGGRALAPPRPLPLTFGGPGVAARRCHGARAAAGGAGRAGHAPPPGHAPGHAPAACCWRAPSSPRDPPRDPPRVPPRQRLRHKEQLLAAASIILRPPLAPPSPREPPALQHAPGGLFQLPPGDPFPQATPVAWLGGSGLALALLCDPRDNLALAETTLRLLAPRLLAALRPPGPPGPGVLLRPDAADLLLERLLPRGQLLFLTQAFLQAGDRGGAR